MNKLIGVLCVASLFSSAVLFAVKPKDPIKAMVGFLGAKVLPIATDPKELANPCVLLDLIAGAVEGEKGIVAHTFEIVKMKVATLTDKQKEAIDMALGIFNKEVAGVLRTVLKCAVEE